ncbi:MAG: TetR/AcrR family transcriptional regulator [Ktedonobacteraceae bacterium]|nr:TetR/AcrR family transcriptional regulator [Ktedonobacteraceae bacterium]
MPRTKEQFDAMRQAAKEKIVAAGLKLFSHKGLAATSIQDIASMAGVSVGLVYHYYRSKEELFNELVETAITSATAGIQAFLDLALPPAEKIRLLSKEILDDIKQGNITNQYYMLMIFCFLDEHIPERSLKMREQAFAPFDLITRIIVEGQQRGEIKPGNPAEMAQLYFAAIQGLAVYKLMLKDAFVAPQPDLLAGLLLK